jgi:FAD/FMN-containing dehydrogenase
MHVTPGAGARELERELAGQLSGAVMGAEHPDFDAARRVYNGLMDRVPALVARPADERDVARIVTFAHARDLELAVRCTGHHIQGFATCEGGIVLDLQDLNAINVDEHRGRVRVGGGCRMGAVNDATLAHGLMSNGGTYDTVGVGGLFLGGGVNYLIRKHGYACDNIMGARVVTADGSVIEVDGESEPELLWALRGAGHAFGVVTEIEARAHVAPSEILAGWLLYDLTDAPEVLRYVRDWVVDLPDELYMDLWLFTIDTDVYPLPAELQGRHALGITVVSDQGNRALDVLRSRFPLIGDTVTTTRYGDLRVRGTQTGGWNRHGLVNYWKCEYLPSLPDEVIDGIVETVPHLNPGADYYLLPIQGQITRQPEGGAAFGGRTPGWMIQIEGIWHDHEEPTEERIAWMQGVHERVLAPHGLGCGYQNATMYETPERMRALFGEEAVARLTALKQRLDPDHVFHRNMQSLIWEADDASS